MHKFLGTIFSGPLISIKSLFLHPHLRGLIPWSLPFKCLQFRILYGCIQKMHPIKVKGFYHDSIEHYILHLSDKHLQEMQSEIFTCLHSDWSDSLNLGPNPQFSTLDFLLNPLLPLVEVLSFIRNPIFCFSFTIRNIIIILFYVKGKEGRKTNFLIYVEEKQITQERHWTSLHSSDSFSSVLPIFIVFV